MKTLAIGAVLLAAALAGLSPAGAGEARPPLDDKIMIRSAICEWGGKYIACGLFTKPGEDNAIYIAFAEGKEIFAVIRRVFELVSEEVIWTKPDLDGAADSALRER